MAIISAAIYSRWEWICSAGGALVRNEPVPAAYVGTFRLRITSEPNHAVVFENGQEIGATPFELMIHRAPLVQRPRQFVLRAPGYQSVAVVQAVTAVHVKPRQAWPPSHSAAARQSTQRPSVRSHSLPFALQSESLAQPVAGLQLPAEQTSSE